MRFGTVVASVVVALALQACSKSEGPEAKPAPAPVNPPAAQQHGTAAKAPDKLAGPIPTVVLQAPSVPEDARHKQTPCDRNEAGWKWVGNLVENGQCVVGPCDCVKG